MALTDLQKAQNKAALSVRNRAHAERYRQLKKALEAAEHAPEVVQARNASDAASAATEAALAERNSKEKALRDQIDALEAQIAALHADPQFEALRAQRRATSGARAAIASKKEQEVEAAFPDMRGNARYSAAAWQPPQKVLDAMEEARRSATVGQATAKKGKGSISTA